MSLSRYEQETVVNFNRAEPSASVYTSDPVWMRKLSRIVEENPQEFKITDRQYANGDLVSMTFEFPKEYIKIRKRKVEYTDEQRAAMAARFKKNTGGKQ